MRLAPLAALAILLAGCATPTPAAPPPGEATALPPASSLDLAWNLTGCRELAVFFEADPAAVRPYLPAGFEPGPGATPASTTVGMDAFRCASGSGVDGDLADVSYASFWAVATPPEDL